MAAAPAPICASNLFAEIRSVQTNIAQLRREKEHCQYLIREYDQLVQTHLGPLLTRLAELQQALAIRKATQSRRRSDFDELKGAIVKSEELRVKSSGSVLQTPSPQPPAPPPLRKLYRQAAALAHPDLFAGNPDQEARATEVMAQLNAAYQREDTEAVQQLLDDLQDGLPFLDLPGATPDAPALERILARLTRTRDAFILELSILRNSENYRIMSNGQLDLTAHLTQLEQRCLNQIELLMNQLGTRA